MNIFLKVIKEQKNVRSLLVLLILLIALPVSLVLVQQQQDIGQRAQTNPSCLARGCEFDREYTQCGGPIYDDCSYQFRNYSSTTRVNVEAYDCTDEFLYDTTILENNSPLCGAQTPTPTPTTAPPQCTGSLAYPGGATCTTTYPNHSLNAQWNVTNLYGSCNIYIRGQNGDDVISSVCNTAGIPLRITQYKGQPLTNDGVYELYVSNSGNPSDSCSNQFKGRVTIPCAPAATVTPNPTISTPPTPTGGGGGPPVSCVIGGPDTLAPGTTFNFYFTPAPADALITSVHWLANGGSPTDFTGPSFTWGSSADGTFTITLILNGNVTTCTKTVTVTGGGVTPTPTGVAGNCNTSLSCNPQFGQNACTAAGGNCDPFNGTCVCLTSTVTPTPSPGATATPTVTVGPTGTPIPTVPPGSTPNQYKIKNVASSGECTANALSAEPFTSFTFPAGQNFVFRDDWPLLTTGPPLKTVCAQFFLNGAVVTAPFSGQITFGGPTVTPTTTGTPTVTPTTGPVSCTNLSLPTLTRSGQNIRGGNEYTISSTGVMSPISVTRNPSDASVSFTPTTVVGSGVLTITPFTDGTGWTLTIPANTSATESSYTLDATVSSAGRQAACNPATIRVSHSTLPACTYSSTEVRFRRNSSENWSSSGTVAANQPVFIAAFHNNNLGVLPSDVVLSVTDPDYQNVSVGSGNNLSFTPTKVGTYFITATTTGMSGNNCIGSLALTVAPGPTAAASPTLAPDATSVFITLNLEGFPGTYRPSRIEEPVVLDFISQARRVTGIQGKVVYSDVSRHFEGNIPLGLAVADGEYRLFVKPVSYLRRDFGIVQIRSRTTTFVPFALNKLLRSCDFNNTNEVDIIDWNQVVDDIRKGGRVKDSLADIDRDSDEDIFDHNFCVQNFLLGGEELP